MKEIHTFERSISDSLKGMYIGGIREREWEGREDKKAWIRGKTSSNIYRGGFIQTFVQMITNREVYILKWLVYVKL